MTTQEILIQARSLIDTPEKWCQDTIGYTVDGYEITVADELDEGAMASSLCAFGAIRAVARSFDTALPASDTLALVVSGAGFNRNFAALDWNNDPERSHAEVLAAFDRAIEAAA